MSVDTFKTDVILFIGDVIMCLASDWLIRELQTDLIFLWIKVSSVIQTLSSAHIKRKMSSLPINKKRMLVYKYTCVVSKIISMNISVPSWYYVPKIFFSIKGQKHNVLSIILRKKNKVPSFIPVLAMFSYDFCNNSHTCMKRSPLGHRKSGLLMQVTS